MDLVHKVLLEDLSVDIALPLRSLDEPTSQVRDIYLACGNLEHQLPRGLTIYLPELRVRILFPSGKCGNSLLFLYTNDGLEHFQINSSSFVDHVKKGLDPLLMVPCDWSIPLELKDEWVPLSEVPLSCLVVLAIEDLHN